MGVGKFIGDLFGAGGLATSVVDILKGTGVLKDPEAIAKAQQALYEFEAKVMEQEARLIESINATMREEAKSEHWLVSSWRPLFGLTAAATIFNNYILLPYFASYGLLPVAIPGEVWNTILIVLGVSAGTRGWEKIMRTKNGK